MHPEGEAGPTSTPAPPSRPPRPQPSSPGNLASALPIASPPGGAPNPPLLPESSLCRWVATGGPEKPRGLGWGELGWRRGAGKRRKQGCPVAAAPVSVPDRGATPPVRVGGQHWVPLPWHPPPQPPIGNFRLRLPRQPWPRGVPQGTRRQGRRRKDTHRDTHARIHDGCRHPAHVWLYSFEPCPGCRATCGDPGVGDSPSPAHRLGYLC